MTEPPPDLRDALPVWIVLSVVIVLLLAATGTLAIGAERRLLGVLLLPALIGIFALSGTVSNVIGLTRKRS